MSVMSDEEILSEIITTINGNRIAVFLKGTPEEPRCGFSARVAGRLLENDAKFIAVDVLSDPRIREQLSAHSGWPTVPQLFVDGTLVGGCDIIEELQAQGELAKILSGE